MSSQKPSQVSAARGDSPYEALTHPVEARVALSTGQVEEVILFLGSRAPSHAGPETLDEFLNHERPFLPVKSKTTEQSFLVNRQLVQRVEVDESAPVLFHIEGKLATSIDLIRLELTDGEVLEGTLCSAQPPERPRLSDYFNQDPLFVPLEIGSGVTYVNKRYVAVVRF